MLFQLQSFLTSPFIQLNCILLTVKDNFKRGPALKIKIFKGDSVEENINQWFDEVEQSELDHQILNVEKFVIKDELTIIVFFMIKPKENKTELQGV